MKKDFSIMENKKVLIIDDDDDLRSNLREVLRRQGHQVETASSGEAAIEKAAKTRFDLVLVDLIMPGMNGLEVLGELKKISPKSKIIMMTAFATIDNAVEAMKKGASDYLSKPFKIEDLDAAVKRTLAEASFDESAQQLGMDFTLLSLSNQIRRDIIRLLDLNKRMRLMEITRALDIEDHTKVVFHLKQLRDTGIIKQKNKMYYLTKEGERMRDCLKILKNHLSK